MAEDYFVTFVPPKQLGPQVTQARLKKVVIDALGQQLVAIYEYGNEVGGEFRPAPGVSPKHVQLDVGRRFGGALQGLLGGVHQAAEREGLL